MFCPRGWMARNKKTRKLGKKKKEKKNRDMGATTDVAALIRRRSARSLNVLNSLEIPLNSPLPPSRLISSLLTRHAVISPDRVTWLYDTWNSDAPHPSPPLTPTTLQVMRRSLQRATRMADQGLSCERAMLLLISCKKGIIWLSLVCRTTGTPVLFLSWWKASAADARRPLSFARKRARG